MLVMFFSMIGKYLGWGAASALTGAVLYANLPTRFTIGAVTPAASYLAGAKLHKVDSEKDVLTAPVIKASELFKKSPALVMAVRRPGCALCRREAAELSTLKDELDKKGIQFFGVVHEYKGVEGFKPFFKGDVYYDEEKRFYGPNQRWLPLWMGFLRLDTYLNAYKAKKRGVKGNMEGEGRLLGGVYFLDDDQMVYAHLEKSWGDAANVGEILAAVRKFN
ncbi:hypothetical protein QR680_005581 [Steinernema hermaphroditum]|uniref:Peroxiredoxin-like 2A n=1 Tax=Steinernema hermaphroditum TaxID=289476 RepID=A0AA39LV49_9BILA|nr:hypothetical protein QR680_005581 [Steinernema hermaphroditum]